MDDERGARGGGTQAVKLASPTLDDGGIKAVFRTDPLALAMGSC